jgi:phage replication O-like protein O
MANPQIENGHIKIANEIFDALIRSNLSGQELRLALFIIRKTYGYNKKEDYISLTQMMDAIGLNKTRASQVINRLRLRNIVTVTEKRNGLTVKYSFQKNYEKWGPLQKSVTVTEKCNDRYTFTKKTVTQKCNHKRQYTKDNITKDKGLSLSDIEFIDDLKKRSIYKDIDIDHELGKMDVWLMTQTKRKKTRRFIVGWLNRIEKPVVIKKPEPIQNKQPEPINEEEHTKVSKLIHETAEKMKATNIKTRGS